MRVGLAYNRLVSDAEAKNLEAISKAIDQHNATCPWPASEVRMNPYEVERLGWDEIRGLPLVGDPAIGTGRFGSSARATVTATSSRRPRRSAPRSRSASAEPVVPPV